MQRIFTNQAAFSMTKDDELLMAFTGKYLINLHDDKAHISDFNGISMFV
jgi:hypothetical protein